MIWRMYVRAAEAAARRVAPLFVPGMLKGWGLPRMCGSIVLRATLACGSIVMPFSLLLAPAQMTPQERRQMDRQGEDIRQVQNQIERAAQRLEAQGDRLLRVENTVTDVVRGHNALDKEVSGAVGIIKSEITSAKWWLGIIWVLSWAVAGLAYKMGHFSARNGTGEHTPVR